jgi:hypothetical protein
MKPKIDPSTVTAVMVRQLLDYDPMTGVFRWREWRGGTALAGSVAGSRDKGGYILLRIGNRNFKAHRIAWLHVHGAWPLNDLDHINGRTDDNRIDNLRDVTRSQNLLNAKLAATNTSGATGVYFDKRRRKWTAQIQINGRGRHIGRFARREDAEAARLAVATREAGGKIRAADRRVG